MELVSGEYRNSIYAPSRKMTAKVTFEIIDEETIRDASVQSWVSEAVVSRPEQVVNRRRDMSNNYATYEPYRFKLDGSMVIPPRSNEGNYEIGWWSDEISDQNGLFEYPQILAINFTKPHSVIDLNIVFDTINGEGAKNFEITVKDANYNPIKELVFFNKEATPIFNLGESVENFQQILITIYTWSTGYRRARITEVDFGLIQESQGEEIVNLSLVEEMDLTGATVPSNELQFTLDNQDKRFNLLNPEGIYRFIKAKQQIRAFMGVEIGENTNNYEFVPIGKYYLTEWRSDEGAMTSTFVGRDIFEWLETIEYTDSLAFVNLFQLAEDVFMKAEISEYRIDEKLKGDITNGFLDVINCREALQSIAIAGRSVIYQDRQGQIVIERIDPLTTSTGFITFPSPDTYAGLTTPEVSNDYSTQAIDFENTFAEPQVELNESVESLIFVLNDQLDPPTELIFHNPDPNIGKGGSVYKIENPLISLQSQAELVASWMFREYNMRGYYRANWRQNPALVCGDAVMIENSFGARKKARIVKQEFQFEGYLTGNTEAVGGV